MGEPVRAGDSFFVSQYVTQRLEEFWPEPDKFDHTRWLNGQKPIHKFSYLPFGAGVRTCPGGHFAMAEMTLIIARALASYEFSLPEADTPARPYEALVTLRPEDGMPLKVTPLSRTMFIDGFNESQRLLDSCLQLRRKVFVENLGWPLKVNEQGQEVDQFDHAASRYLAYIHKGRLMGTARVLPAEAPTLLYDVFAHLISAENAAVSKSTVWEGARLALAPNLTAHESRSICSKLLASAVKAAMDEGIEYIYSVSDPVMERVLIRAGAKPERLGPVIVDEFGIPALALRIACTPIVLNSCERIANLASSSRKSNNDELLRAQVA